MLEALAVPAASLVAAMALFGVFMALQGHNPLEVFALVYKGGFSTTFAWGNSLSRAAPLVLTALCVAIPAQAGLMVIGGEGALVLGGLAAALVGQSFTGSPLGAQLAMAAAGMLAGGLWIALAGALRQYRGVNETIASLLLTYVAAAVLNHCVEGPFRDPGSLNKPSTLPIAETTRIGTLPGGLDVHWGLGYGVLFCAAAYVLVRHTTHGLALRVVGGNTRAARLVGLPVGPLVLGACFLGGAAAGLAGMAEVAAVHGSANASLLAGYGYAGILVSFIARHNPLAIVPVAVLLGGFSASGGMLQRRLDLPDATVLVLQGLAFMTVLAAETLYGRLRLVAARAEPA
jgi:general nucleoside transport system permease protein